MVSPRDLADIAAPAIHVKGLNQYTMLKSLVSGGRAATNSLSLLLFSSLQRLDIFLFSTKSCFFSIWSRASFLTSQEDMGTEDQPITDEIVVVGLEHDSGDEAESDAPVSSHDLFGAQKHAGVAIDHDGLEADVC